MARATAIASQVRSSRGDSSSRGATGVGCRRLGEHWLLDDGLGVGRVVGLGLGRRGLIGRRLRRRRIHGLGCRGGQAERLRGPPTLGRLPSARVDLVGAGRRAVVGRAGPVKKPVGRQLLDVAGFATASRVELHRFAIAPRRVGRRPTRLVLVRRADHRRLDPRADQDHRRIGERVRTRHAGRMPRRVIVGQVARRLRGRVLGHLLRRYRRRPEELSRPPTRPSRPASRFERGETAG